MSSDKELVHYLNLSNEALRAENKRLMDENERLINNIEVKDAEVICNSEYAMPQYYQFMNEFNNLLITKQ